MPKQGVSSRPSSASSNASSRSSKSRAPEKGLRPDVGPRPNQDICISEEVKIGINLAIERFRMNESQKELEFPTSLTATERAYIHRICDDLGYAHKSKGTRSNRFLSISKKGSGSKASRHSSFQLVRNSRYQVTNMLQRFPVTNKERLELLPSMDQTQVNEVSKELARTATGRLNNGVPQIPPPRGDSDLKGFTEGLPIRQYRDAILQTVGDNQVSLISGETGSGKTTQVPQMILDECYENKKPCRIYCTQPRRIAALSISERVAAERGEKVGHTVGFQIRLESRVSPKTLLVFCTNGVLLRTLMGNESALNTVTHVIVDEIHERDKYSDFLLISLREAARRNPGLKVILMSATMNTELFEKYFGICATLSVPGNLFHVEEYFLEDVIKWTGYSSKKMEKYKRDSAKMANGQEQLSQWCDKEPLHKKKQKSSTVPTPRGEMLVQEIDGREEDDRAELTKQLASLGLEKEKEELEPWVTKEMDQLMSQVWMSGNEELFPQIIHLIMSENVSVDYQHSQTSVTPLMIAAGRGFPEMVNQLLGMGAEPELKSVNDWTALSWARKFKQDDIVALLEAHVLATQQQLAAKEEDDLSADVLSEEDRQLLTVYQHCWNDDRVDIDLITSLLHKIVVTQPEGAVLIFLPGYDEIVNLRNRIDEDNKFGSSRYSLFLLHSAMQTSDQKKVFRASPPGVRKIILATNIAETSITINDVVYVIDAGKVKEKTFDALLQITMLKSNWISRASATQRKGRAGRLRPGVCYHLFSKVRHQSMNEYATPELLRCPLQELCLQTKLLALANESISDFLSKAPEAPPFLIIRSAVSVLKEMDALDHNEELTELGRHLADLPVEPHLGKMVLNSIVLKCVDPVLTIVCTLSYKSPFMLPTVAAEKRNVGLIQKEFASSTFSDHMAMLRAFQSWQKARTDGWEKSFCARNYISSAVMEMIVGMRAQLLGQLRASGFVRARGGGDIRDLNTNSENWSVVKSALCAGAYPSVIRVDKQRRGVNLVGQMKEKVMIHMTSVLPQKQDLYHLPTDWLFYEEMTRAGQLACVRCCTAVAPVTVAIFSGPAKLPANAVKDPSSEGYDFEMRDSDSENDDPDEHKSSVLTLADWLSFKIDQEAASLILQLRQKWHSLFLRRMRAPSKPWSQMDEAVINAVVNVLTNEEQALGLQQPAGIGQRPRPMSAESIMSGGSGISGGAGMPQAGGGGASRGYPVNAEYMDPNNRHRFSTSAKKATSTPPKRKDFMSPKSQRSDDSSANNSPSLPYGQQWSGNNTPSGSPHYAGSQHQAWHSHDPGAMSTGPSRYFIMKCGSQKNIDVSVSRGAWATSKANEKKLNKAFQDGKTVYLIYSVQGSGHFQGYAKMASAIGTEKSSDYNGQGGVFSVDWVKRGNLQFQATHHLLNPWNENKRVQVSRDGQEVEPSVGEALVNLWEQKDGATGSRWSDGYSQMNRRGYAHNGQYDEQEGYPGEEGQYGQGYYGEPQYYDPSYDPGYGYNQWSGHPNTGGGHHYNNQQGHFRGSNNSAYAGYQHSGAGYQSEAYHYHDGRLQGSGSPHMRGSPVMILQRDGNQRHGEYGRAGQQQSHKY